MRVALFVTRVNDLAFPQAGIATEKFARDFAGFDGSNSRGCPAPMSAAGSAVLSR
jgi:hypothetical protein